MKAWCIEHRAKGKGHPLQAEAMGISMRYAPCSMPFTQRGFSLVELLISMVIASIVGMAGYVIFSTSNWSYKVQEDVAEAQQNVRVAMERLAKDIRTAGFGLPDPPFSLTFGGNTFTSPITVSDSSANADTITILGIGYEAGTLQSAVGCTNVSGTNDICMNTASFFSDAGNYMPARRYISLNGTTFIELSNNTAVHVNDAQGSMRLSSPTSLDRSYPDGTPVYIIQAVQYTINNSAPYLEGCSANVPCLASLDYTGLRGGDGDDRWVLAENIEDIQFAYGIDSSPLDGEIDYAGAYDEDDFTWDPADDSSIIAVRATVVAKTRNEDPRGARVFLRPDAENHAVADTPDGYRRRVITKIIKLRNARTGG